MMKSSTLRCSFGSIQRSGSKVPSDPSPRGTWAAILLGMSATSNFSMRLTPLRPAMSRCHVGSMPLASGVTMPRPVTTTRLIIGTPGIRPDRGDLPCPRPQINVRHPIWYGCHGRAQMSCNDGRRPRRSAFGVLFEELDRVADGQNGLRRVVGNLATEFLFEGHDEFDRVEAIGAEIIDEAGVIRDLVGLDAQMLHDDLLYPLANITHCSNLFVQREPINVLVLSWAWSLSCKWPWVVAIQRRICAPLSGVPVPQP